MTRVLVADSDESLASAMMRSLTHHGIEAIACCSPARARACLREQRFHLLVFDHRWHRSSGPSCSAAQMNTRVILTASFLGPGEERRLVQRYTLLRKPFSSLELLSVMRRELGEPSLPPASAIDALRRAHSRSTTVCLRAQAASDRVTESCVYVDRGEVVHAVFGALEGSAALREILRRGRVGECSTDASPARSIDRPFKQLMFEILQDLDVPGPGGARARLTLSPGLHKVVE